MNLRILLPYLRPRGRGRVRRRTLNPILAIYRWRWEIGLLAVVVALVRLGQVAHPAVPLLLVTSIAAAVALCPPAARAAVNRCWAVVIQHRLRTAFHELGLTASTGSAPAILWTSVRGGLRVHLLCPAGIGVTDLAAVHEQLAAACFAAAVQVERDPRHANVVVLVVVTRIPSR